MRTSAAYRILAYLFCRKPCSIAEASVITFNAAAVTYVANRKHGWKNEKHAEQWTNTLATYASPVLGSLPVGQIETALVMRVLQPIWATKTETASRIRGRVEKVLDWCKTQGYRQGDNPARWKGYLENLLSAPKKTKTVEQHPPALARDRHLHAKASQNARHCGSGTGGHRLDQLPHI